MIAAALVVRPDSQQAGELTLATGVRLQRHRRVPGALGQPFHQLMDHVEVTTDLVDRRERVDVGELRPGDRQHFGGGVQLHRARSERNHGAIERQIPIRQSPQIPQHGVLAAIGMEHRVRQQFPGSAHIGRQPMCSFLAGGGRCIAGSKEDHETGDEVGCGGFIQADADGGGIDVADIDPLGSGCGHSA